MNKFALSAAVLLLFVSPAWAAVTVTTSTGIPHTTTGLSTFETEGDMMDGMTVTAVFSTGPSETAIWGDDGAGAGRAAFGTQTIFWSLEEDGDTYGNHPLDGFWTLRNRTGRTMTQLIINAAPGKTVFDVNVNSSGTLQPGKGTNKGTDFAPNGLSEHGTTFQLVGTIDSDLNILATYKNSVQIGANPPVGDLWTTLDLQFSGDDGGLRSGANLTFEADTDNSFDGAPIEPATGPVPEPATLTMWALGGLGCAAGAYRRRKRA